MKHSLKIVLWLISLAFLLNACSLRHHSGYKKTEAFETKEYDFIAHHFQKVLFNTRIQVLGNEASGLLFIKLMDKDDYRFVFLTQLGMKIFDVELCDNQFKIHQLISYLDKKNIRRILENDLKLLIRTPDKKYNSEYFVHKSNKQYLLRESYARNNNYYQYANQKINLKENSGILFLRTQIHYFYKGGTLPEKIKIKHSGINIEWQLQPIKKKLKQEHK